MKQEDNKKEKDITSIVALLTEDNKYYVIAVAKALLFTQNHKETEEVSGKDF